MSALSFCLRANKNMEVQYIVPFYQHEYFVEPYAISDMDNFEVV